MKKTAFALALATVTICSPAYAGDWKNHPHLHKAHNQIENAKKSLQEANDKENSEFGGHRARAIELLNQAQQEIEASVQWADTHR